MCRRTDSPRRTRYEETAEAVNAACNEKNTENLIDRAYESNIDCSLPIIGSHYFRSTRMANEPARRSRSPAPQSEFIRARRTGIAARRIIITKLAI